MGKLAPGDRLVAIEGKYIIEWEDIAAVRTQLLDIASTKEQVRNAGRC